MQDLLRNSMIAIATIALMALTWVAVGPTSEQAPASQIPITGRDSDPHPPRS